MPVVSLASPVSADEPSLHGSIPCPPAPPMLLGRGGGASAPDLGDRGDPWPGVDLAARCRALGEDARHLGPGGPGLRWLTQAARSLAEVMLPWELAVGAPGDERSYRLLLRTEAVEAWLIHWPSGGRLQLHDHGGASGALRVVSGELSETYVDGHCRLAQRSLGAGRGVAFGPSYIHDVANTTEVGATSVHVYAPTTDTMSFYRYEGPGHLRRVGEAPFEETDETDATRETDESGHAAVASCSGDPFPH